MCVYYTGSIVCEKDGTTRRRICKSVEYLQGERRGDSGLVCLEALMDLVGGILYFPFVILGACCFYSCTVWHDALCQLILLCQSLKATDRCGWVSYSGCNVVVMIAKPVQLIREAFVQILPA